MKTLECSERVNFRYDIDDEKENYYFFGIQTVG